MKKPLTLIKGGRIKGAWMQDPDIPQEDIDVFNAALREMAEQDPRWLQLVWEPRKEKPDLKVVK